MKALSPTARRLLDLSLGQDEPDGMTRDRVARSLAARIASGAPLGGLGTAMAATPAMSGATSASLGAVVAKSVAVVCVTGAVATGGWLTLRSSAPSPQPRPAVTAPAPAAPSPAPSLAPTPRVAPANPELPVPRKPARPVVRPEPKVTAPAPYQTPDRLREETEALRSAQQALRDGRARLALGLLEAQDARFPDGLLQQERAAARVLALCQAGSVAQARAQAESFERRWPRSALTARVRFACWRP